MSHPYVGPVAHTNGNGNLPIRRLVVHCTAGNDGFGARGTAAYFRDPNSTGSAHEVIDSDEVLICAYDDVICWHAPPNSNSKGYELECSLANDGKGHWELASHIAMLKLLSKEVARDCVKYDIPVRHLTVAQVAAGEKGICGHVDVTNAFHQSTHTDPGPYFPWSKFISMVAAEVAAITGGAGGTPIPPAPEGDLTVAEADRVIKYIDEQIKSGSFYERYAQDINEQRAFKDAALKAVDALYARVVSVETALASLATAEQGRYGDVAGRVQAGNDEERGRYADYVSRFNDILLALDDVRQTLEPVSPPPTDPPVVVTPPKA